MRVVLDTNILARPAYSFAGPAFSVAEGVVASDPDDNPIVATAIIQYFQVHKFPIRFTPKGFHPIARGWERSELPWVESPQAHVP